MRRYQLSGLEHVHMMRHIPRSYDMTRTHIMHKSVNKHVDVVLRCSPKNWKKKKVTVSVVRSEKKTDAARIRANAKKGYVAVRKVVNDQFEADRKAAAAAYETKYATRSAGSDALIHDMKSQISTMAQKSADFIDDQLTSKPSTSYAEPKVPAPETKSPVNEEPLISPESEKILKKGGYRLPNSQPESSPYSTDYIMHASNEEFHNLMDSLEKSLDEACKKYAVQPSEPEIKVETEPEQKREPEQKPETENGKTDFGYEGYYGYSGSYHMPGDISLSVTKKQEKKADEEEDEDKDIFKPTLTFTEGGQNIPEDDLFDRELNRPGETYVPPVNFFDEDETAPSGDLNDSAFVPLPDYDAMQQPSLQPQNVFYTEEDGMPMEQDAEEKFADQAMFDNISGSQEPMEEESGYEPPMVFPDRNDMDTDPSESFYGNDEDDAPLPVIFPDSDDDEGYSPAPVSPDRHENYDDDADNQGVMDRSGQTLFSRTGDQIKNVIGIIRGSSDNTVRSKKNGSSMQNRNVEITYSDRKN